MMVGTNEVVCFQGEAMLAGWADSSTRGRTVTFRLDETDSEAHPFKDGRVASGKSAGQRYMMVLVQIGDDEQPVVQRPSQLAALACKDAQFWHFLNERSFVTIDSEEAARAHILEACGGISSRAKLDTSLEARAAWEQQIWNPWQAYRQKFLGAV